MDDQAVRALAEEEKTYWWHISRRAILQTILNRFHGLLFCHPERNDSGVEGSPPLDSSTSLGMTREEKLRILDVGCGTGENFYWLSKFGEIVGTDTSELAVALAAQKGKAVLGRAEDLPVESGEFDLVTAFDVLEHLADESRVLGEWGRVLLSGGLLFISVPAYQSLFGPHDRALGHFRRYNLRPLTKLLQNNGFNIIFSSYFFCLTFPLFWLQRIFVKKSSQALVQYIAVPKWINNFLIGVGKVESWWLSFAKFPFGSSIVILAKKSHGNASTPLGK
ncbi:MAG: class I SAM-dependent methyltransferase [Patescibacteria group bacterium]|jgi:SAM-dependent methyltransferase